MENSNKQKKLTTILFIIYLFVLTWIILFKFSFRIGDLPKLRNINLIPFKASVIVNGKLQYRELIQNILAFIPFGLYLSMLKSDLTLWKKIALGAGLSLVYEVLQFIFALGATDITDLINNTFGGMVGCGLYTLFYKFLKSKTNKVLNILTLLGTFFIVVLMGILIVVNF